jgi:hypothetical protein
VWLQPGVAQDEGTLRKSIAQWNIYLKISALRTITEEAVTAHAHGGRVHNAGRYDQLRSRELDQSCVSQGSLSLKARSGVYDRGSALWCN